MKTLEEGFLNSGDQVWFMNRSENVELANGGGTSGVGSTSGFGVVVVFGDEV